MDKFSGIRDYLLTQIETGRYPAGSQLPSSRDLAAQLNASFILVQHAVSSLEQDGVVECVLRKGTFVREGWERRIIRNHMVVFNRQLPWLDGFQALMAERVPGLRFARGFETGIFELRTTIDLQAERDEYMDLSPFLPDDFLSDDRFFAKPFQGFIDPGRRVFAIPFIFSPRVVLLNRSMLKACGLPLPDRQWDWGQFTGYVRTLAKRFPPERVLNFVDRPFFWMNFLLRAGGRIFDRKPDGSREVRLDDPATLRGLELLRELRAVLACPDEEILRLDEPFLRGEMAMAVTDREFCCRLRHSGFDDWDAVPFPTVPGGRSLVAQSTNLICVRRQCADNRLAEQYIRFMLSPETQSFIGGEGYGIPIMKRAAMESIDPGNPRDMVFLGEMNHMSAEFNLDSPLFAQIVQDGIQRLLYASTPLAAEAKRLADALRVVVELVNNRRQPGSVPAPAPAARRSESGA